MAGSEINQRIIKDKFKIFEKKHDLFNLKINNIKIWQFIRFDIYMEILRKIKLNNISQDPLEKKINVFTKMFLKNPQMLTKQNPLFGTPKDILIFNHPRKKKIKNEFYSIYTDFFIEKTMFKTLTMENVYETRQISKNNKIKYLDLIVALSAIISPFFNLIIKKNEILEIKKIEYYIFKNFNAKIDVFRRIKKIIKKRFALRKLLKLLLYIYKPKLIIEVVYYIPFLMILNEICKEKNIPTIEFQHGFISPYHMAYDFPANVNLDVFPKYFFSFGKFWEETTNLPLSPKYIKTIGFPFFEYETNKFRKLEFPKKILFISQGSIGFKLSQYARKLVDITDIKITYKLHPGEIKRWKSDYPWLIHERIQIIENEEIPLYKLFSMTQILIGVNSTALIEALNYNIPIFIFKLSGYESMDYLIKNSSVILVENPEEIKNYLEKIRNSKNQPTSKIQIEQFFKKNALKNQLKEINQIMHEIVE